MLYNVVSRNITFSAYMRQYQFRYFLRAVMYDDHRVNIDKEKLQNWTKAEATKTSQNRFAKDLGTTATTINRWVYGRVDAVTGKQLKAIAAYRGEAIEDTLSWIALPETEPVNQDDFGDLVAKFNHRIAKLEQDNELLKEEKDLLREEIDDLKEFVEVLAAEFHDSKRTKPYKAKV